MGISKTANYPNELIHLAQLAKALAHPARLTILQHVHHNQSAYANELTSILSLSQPTVATHLAELKNAQLIVGNVRGTAMHYSIHADTLQKLSDFLATFTQTTPHDDRRK